VSLIPPQSKRVGTDREIGVKRIESGGDKGLRQDVSELVFARQKFNNESLESHMFPKKMIININVFFVRAWRTGL
jgi:hypothetical protein